MPRFQVASIVHPQLRGWLMTVAMTSVVSADLNAKAHSTFPNTTTGHAMFAPFTMETTSVVPDTFLSFNFDVRFVCLRLCSCTIWLFSQTLSFGQWNLNVSAVDAWSNASVGWTLDLQSPKLRMLAKAMSPANLRIGGSPEDTAEYQGFGDNHICR